jgi:hypothetical protein
LFLLLPLAAWVRAADAHVPPAVFCKLAVTDVQVEFRVVASFKVFQNWYGIDPNSLASDGALTADQHAAVLAKMNAWLRVEIDGEAGTGTLHDTKIERFQDHLQDWQFVHVRMTFAAPQPPGRVTFQWTNYDTGADYYFYEIDAELDAYEESYYPLFRAGEPEFTWHRPRETRKPEPPVLPPPPVAPHMQVPLLSLGLLLAVLAGALFVPGRTTPRRLALALAVGVVVALPLQGVGRVSVPLPGDAQLTRPSDEQALSIFAALHHGIYTAVGGANEDEIYDALAKSVTGPLLETLYLDINQSMILHDEGGVVAKVKRTQILESEVLPDQETGAPWFKVRARWRVEGKVGHYAHTHQRINEYLADVTVVAASGQWRIAAIEVLDETSATTSSQDR